MVVYPWCGDDIRQGEEIIRGECAKISGAGSIEYFIVMHIYYKYTTGLVFLFFGGDRLPGGGLVIYNAWISFNIQKLILSITF